MVDGLEVLKPDLVVEVIEDGVVEEQLAKAVERLEHPYRYSELSYRIHAPRSGIPPYGTRLRGCSATPRRRR